LPHCNNSPRRLNQSSPSFRGLRGGLRGELSERLAAYQAASWALGVVPEGAGEKVRLKFLSSKVTHDRGEDLRRCSTNPHSFDCGIALHARTMSVCLMQHDADIVLHRKLKAAPEPFLKALAPSRDHLGVAVEWMCT
jgi:hypothetical protein